MERTDSQRAEDDDGTDDVADGRTKDDKCDGEHESEPSCEREQKRERERERARKRVNVKAN